MIRSINQAGMVTTLVGTGVSGYTSDGQPGTSTQISLPLSVFVNTNGDVFFTHSSNLVRKLSKSTNIVTTVAGKLSANTAIDGVPATMSGLSTPRALWGDTTGRLFIADSVNYRIRLVNSSSIITTYAGKGTTGYSGDNNPAILAEFKAARDIIGDSNGNLFILDSMQVNLRKVNNAGIITTLCDLSGYFVSPTGFWYQQNENAFYITDAANQWIQRVSSTSCVASLIVGSGLGMTSTNMNADSALLNGPFKVCADTSNYLYFTQSGNKMLNSVDISGNKIYILTAIPPFTYYGDGLTPTSARLNSPSGIWGNTWGTVYIVDRGNQVIRFVSNLTTTINLQLRHSSRINRRLAGSNLHHRFNIKSYLPIATWSIRRNCDSWNSLFRLLVHR